MEMHSNNTKLEASSITTSQSNLLKLVIKEVNEKYDYQKLLLQASKKFQIKQYNILSLSIPKIQNIYQNLKSKFYSEPTLELNCDQWYDNELRLFVWLLVIYSHVYKRSPEDLTKKQWAQFSQIFQGKTFFLFEYQAKIIKKQTKKSKKWTLEEDQSLNLAISHFTTLLGPIKTFKWSEVAKKLFISSNKKHFRTPKQCRQRWMNHLDPEKVKSKWTLFQDYQLIDYAVREGKKWALIAKIMGGTRTEHMVKNRYNSLLRAEMKKHEEMGDQSRIIKKLLYRIKYLMESKSSVKEVVEIEQIKIELQEYPSFSENYLINSQCASIEEFDNMVESLAKQIPNHTTAVNLLQFDEEQNRDEVSQNYISQFEMKPTFPDIF